MSPSFLTFSLKSALRCFLTIALLPLATSGFNDFQTDSPKLIITVQKELESKLDAKDLEKTNRAKEMIREYYSAWQTKFGRIRRNLRINLIPTERQIDFTGSRAEGVWSWKSFENEEGTATMGVSGDLYVNLNSAYISQEALVAHEASHAFLITYQPKLLESWKNLTMFNEGLAELFSVDYEPKPWRGWKKVALAKRFNDSIRASDISSYGHRILNMLNQKPLHPHDVGFFYLFVVRNGKVNLDEDLKHCTDTKIKEEISGWLKSNGESYDLPMINE